MQKQPCIFTPTPFSHRNTQYSYSHTLCDLISVEEVPPNTPLLEGLHLLCLTPSISMVLITSHNSYLLQQAMAEAGIHLRLSSPILLNPDRRTCCFPVSVGIPRISRLSGKPRRFDCSGRKERNGFLSSDSGFYPGKDEGEGELKPMWDDGYGSQTVMDYVEGSRDLIKPDGGPPRWFCPIESGPPLDNSPLLLYIPGMDGLGMGMVLHHKALGKVFEVRCMHIPVYDRTPFEGLVKFVENTVRAEHALFPNRPIYLVGDSFGGCLALSVAALNPTLDLVLILVNPATSFNRSHLQPLISLLEAFPEQLHTVAPYIMATTFGDPVKMAKVEDTKTTPIAPAKQIQKLLRDISAFISGIPYFADIFPKETLIWKLKLLKSGAAFANSRLHAVKCQVLILASGKDSMLPSTQEAQRLYDILENSRVRFFKDNGHALLVEHGSNLLTLLKCTFMYRRSKFRDPIADYLPPSRSEYLDFFQRRLRLFNVAVSPVMLSTLPDGEIVRGLTGIPDRGPVLLVGYHMLLGTEIICVMDEFLREKNVVVHGLAHPQVFNDSFLSISEDTSASDCMKVFGAVPVTPKNMMKLLMNKSYVLLYPGGVREALHRKGEDYQLFWPEEPEFVRMAVRFGAKIVPFGVVGEDDLVELVLDYNDMMKIPAAREVIERENENMARVRAGSERKGEVSNQEIFKPCFYPKVPGRFYFLFGKAIEAEGREEVLTDKVKAKELYLEIKSEVEKNMEYLKKKREEDPYRQFFDRLVYSLVRAPVNQIPTFDP